MKNQMNDMAALFLYCRRKKKLSQRTMAKLLRVNQSTICRIECSVITPRKRTCEKLAILMDIPINELLSFALKTKSVLTSTENVVLNTSLQTNELDYNHLSDSDLSYLRSKWFTLITEAENTYKKKSYRLKKRTKRFLLDQLLLQHLEDQQAHHQSLRNYLAKTGSSEGMISDQTQHIAALKSVKQHFGCHKQVHSSVELFLQKVAIEEMAVVRRFRMDKLRELPTR